MDCATMPQIVLEYTNNLKDSLNFQELFFDIHQICHKITGVLIANIKSRAYPLEQFYIADGDALHAFVHLTVALLEGRSLEIKRQLGEALLVYLEDQFKIAKEKLKLQITVKIEDIQKSTYFKYPKDSFTPQ